MLTTCIAHPHTRAHYYMGQSSRDVYIRNTCTAIITRIRLISSAHVTLGIVLLY